MKTFIAICIFVFVHNSYGKYISRHLLETSTCKSVEFDNGNVEFNHFVSNHMRSELCAKNIHNYNATGRMPSKYLGEEYNMNSHQNPCTVVCRYDPLHESIVDHEVVVDPHEPVVAPHEPVVVEHVQEKYYEGEVSAQFSYAQYKSLPLVEFKLAEHTKCGEQHVCDAYGCCVAAEVVVHPEEPKEPEEPVVVHPEEPKTPEEPKVDPVEPVEPHVPHTPEETPVDPEPHVPVDPEPHVPVDPEPHVPVDPEPHVPVDPEPHVPVDPEPHVPVDPEPHVPVDPEPHVPEPQVPEREYSCTEAGVFADSEDENSFFRCYLKSAHIKCAEGMVFNKETHECHTPVPPEPDFEKLISCSHEGFFRNPFDCKRFYRCYHNDELEKTAGVLRIGFFQCRDDMVFEEASQTCVLATATQECKNIQVPNEPEDVVVDKEPEYQKIIQCTHEGYFRNPYECHRFYRCFYNHHSETTLNLALYVCGHGKVFDEVSKNCVPQERTSECLNKQLPVEEQTHYRH